MGVFSSVRVLDESSLDPHFVRAHLGLLKKSIRGFGYWVWKPQVILQSLRDLGQEEVLIYADIGFHLEARGRERLLSHVAELTKSSQDLLVFQSVPPIDYPMHDGRKLPTHIDAEWCKGDTLDALGMRKSPLILEPTVQAGLIYIQVNDRSIAFFEEWNTIMQSDIHLIDDSPSHSANIPGFHEHRHDQSIFSLLVKKKDLGIRKSGFEFWYPSSSDIQVPDWDALSLSPFLAKRDKARKRGIPGKLFRKWIRKTKAIRARR